MCVCINADLFALSAFDPLFTAGRGKSVTHLLFLHDFIGSFCREICIYLQVGKDVKDECMCYIVV